MSPVMILIGLVFLVAVIVIINSTSTKKSSHKEAGVVLDKAVFKEPEPLPDVSSIEVVYQDAKVLTDLTEIGNVPVLTDKVAAPKAMKPAVKAKTAPRVQKSTKPAKAIPAAPVKKKKVKKAPKA